MQNYITVPDVFSRFETSCATLRDSDNFGVAIKAQKIFERRTVNSKKKKK